MANYKRGTGGLLKDLNWKNLHIYIARRIMPDQGENYYKKADDVYEMLIHLADMFWEEHQTICGAKTHPEIRKEIGELSQSMSKDSLLYMFISQGAKQFMFPSCQRGRGIYLNKPKEGEEASNSQKEANT